MNFITEITLLCTAAAASVLVTFSLCHMLCAPLLPC